MSSTFDKLCTNQLINDYPSHMKNNIHYEVIMGSTAYGVSDDSSDIDIYGFCMPPKHILFPYQKNHIVGFGKKPENFEQFQKHHIIDKGCGKEYDVSIYNIVKFFNLCMENNPNMVDALFVPNRCVLHSTQIGEYVRENRKMFLSKRVWHKFKGYAFSQLHKMNNKYLREFVRLCDDYYIPYDLPLTDTIDLMTKKNITNDKIHRMSILIKKIESNGNRSKRIDVIIKYGYDTKFAYHVVRLIDECHQILEEGDLDLTRSRNHLKAIRRGEWDVSKVEEYFEAKLKIIEGIYDRSTLRYSPDEDSIRNLLLECIEMHYGTVENYGNEDRVCLLLSNVQDSLSKIEKLL